MSLKEKQNLRTQIIASAHDLFSDDNETYEFLVYLVSLPSLGLAQLKVLNALLETNQKKLKEILNRKADHKQAALDSLKLKLKDLKNVT